jgi:uncharacterized protein (TIGR02246 family)
MSVCKKGWVAAALALFLLASASAQDKTKTVRTALDSVNRQFSDAVKKGDAASIAKLYAKDAQLYPPGEPIVSGHDNIQKYWSGFIEKGMKGLALNATEVYTMGNHAAELGTFTVTGADGKKLDEGKYVVIWKKSGNQWQLYRDSWSSNGSK